MQDFRLLVKVACIGLLFSLPSYGSLFHYSRIITRLNPNLDEFTKLRIVSLAKEYAKDNKLETSLVLAVIAAESTFNPFAIGPKHEVGLMQLNPQYFTVTFEIEDNIRTGTEYLQKLRGNTSGIGWVKRYNCGYRCSGTTPYQQKVTRYYNLFKLAER